MYSTTLDFPKEVQSEQCVTVASSGINTESACHTPNLVHNARIVNDNVDARNILPSERETTLQKGTNRLFRSHNSRMDELNFPRMSTSKILASSFTLRRINKLNFMSENKELTGNVYSKNKRKNGESDTSCHTDSSTLPGLGNKSAARRGGCGRKKRTKYDGTYQEMENLGSFEELAKRIDISKVEIGSAAGEILRWPRKYAYDSWKEGFSIRLGADGRRLLLRKLRAIYATDTLYWKRIFRSHGLNIKNLFTVATLPQIFKITYLMGRDAWGFALKCACFTSSCTALLQSDLDLGGECDNALDVQKYTKCIVGEQTKATQMVDASHSPSLRRTGIEKRWFDEAAGHGNAVVSTCSIESRIKGRRKRKDTEKVKGNPFSEGCRKINSKIIEKGGLDSKIDSTNLCCSKFFGSHQFHTQDSKESDFSSEIPTSNNPSTFNRNRINLDLSDGEGHTKKLVTLSSHRDLSECPLHSMESVSNHSRPFFEDNSSSGRAACCSSGSSLGADKLYDISQKHFHGAFNTTQTHTCENNLLTVHHDCAFPDGISDELHDDGNKSTCKVVQNSKIGELLGMREAVTPDNMCENQNWMDILNVCSSPENLSAKKLAYASLEARYINNLMCLLSETSIPGSREGCLVGKGLDQLTAEYLLNAQYLQIMSMADMQQKLLAFIGDFYRHGSTVQRRITANCFNPLEVVIVEKVPNMSNGMKLELEQMVNCRKS